VVNIFVRLLLTNFSVSEIKRKSDLVG